MTGEAKHGNRLVSEASPYLLQHAANPVDWYSWGQAAFERARQTDRPIFLSIGYSTCHWCHVMAHESFENRAIADYLNSHFVSIKVDREERPDIDAVYMDFVQQMTGSGGWPLTVFLTPDGKPFYGGTYYPPTDMYGRPGFMTLLKMISHAWQDQHDELVDSAEKIAAAMQQAGHSAGALDLNENVLKETYLTLGRIYDAGHGGFGQAPKFPQPGMLSFLMVYAKRSGDKKPLKMVEHTLDRMCAGGIYDHLGGGFHRYSVDAEWLVPHFEKMLYDQALITRAYVQGFQLTQNPLYRNAACDVMDYVLRDMQSQEGGFYSAEDADSEGREGQFYVWKESQIDELLNEQQSVLIKSYYHVTQGGNFDGANIFHVTVGLEEAAVQCGIEIQRAQVILDEAKRILYEARCQRVRPGRDEKMITAWNGLMISSLAYTGRVFSERRYISAANRCADFVLEHLYYDNRLKRHYTQHQAHGVGTLNDYAFLIQGLLDLYAADFESKRLQTACRMTRQMVELFFDDIHGGFYMTGSDTEPLFVRKMPDQDGVIPSGNSAAVSVLIKLSELTGDGQWLPYAEKTLAYYQDELRSRGASMTDMLVAADLWMGPRSEIVLAGSLTNSVTQRMIHELNDYFLPRSVVLVRDESQDSEMLESVSPMVCGRKMIDGKTTAYVCRDFTCHGPLTEIDDFCRAVENSLND